MLVAYLTLIALTAVWGLTFPVVQNALHDASPMVFVSVRFALAAVFFALLVWPRAFRLTRQHVVQGLWLGILVWGGYAFQTIGLSHTTSARSGFITGTLVPMTPLFSWLLFREKIRLRIWLAALLAFAGVWIMSQPDIGGLSYGDALTLLCAACFALQIVYVGRWANQKNETQLVWLQLVFVSLLSAISLPMDQPRFVLSSYLVFALAVTAVFGSALGLWGQLRFQPLISATAAAIIYACEPIFAGLAAWLLQGEKLPPSTLIGAVFIVAGMVLSALRTQNKLVLS